MTTWLRSEGKRCSSGSGIVYQLAAQPGKADLRTMSDSVSKFQAEVAAVMEVLLKVAVIEITKVFEGRSFLSKDCTVDGQPNIHADFESLPTDLKAYMEDALGNTTNKTVSSVGVQVDETTPVDAHGKSAAHDLTRERHKFLVQAPHMGEGLASTATPYTDLVETVDLQCTVDLPCTIFNEKIKGETEDAFTTSPALVDIQHEELFNQEHDVPEQCPVLQSSSLEHEPHLFSIVTTDISTADHSNQSLDHSHPEVLSLLVVEEPTKVEPIEIALSIGEQAHLDLEKPPCAATTVNASCSLTGVKKVKLQVNQTPFDCNMLRPCSVQLVNLLLISGPKKRTNCVCSGEGGFKDLRCHQGPHTGRRLCCFTACGNGVWRLHTGPVPGRTYACKICSKTFKRRKILRRHCRFHTGEKPYSCPDCSKTFALRKSLRRHERFHSGERPHACPRCGKTFRLRDNLKAHQRFHTGEKPFTCSLCSKGFRIYKNLQKHGAVHSLPGS